jgi:phosphate transport system substrate-binding protein
MINQIRACALILGLLLTAGAWAVDFTGAGATFPAPIYKKWAENYRKQAGFDLSYQAIGSGEGIKLVGAKSVDFGASDMPLAPAELAKQGLVQFPTVVSGIVPVVNVPGIGPNKLKLDGKTLANIYLGKITKWNDQAIAGLNPDLALPDAKIAVIHRSDNSGSTFIFTSYLSKVSADWQAAVGEGMTVSWKVGSDCWTNQTMPICVARTPNSIAYIDYVYATKYNMSTVQMKNRAGQFVAPDSAAFKAAAHYANWDPATGFYAVLTDQPGETTWPLAGASFILMSKVQANPEHARNVLKFFDWAYTQGDAAATDLGYVPLPDKVQHLVRETWITQIKDAPNAPAPAVVRR